MAAGDEYFTNLLKFEILYSGERNTAANIFYAQCTGAHGASLANLVTLATDVSNAWGTHIMPYISESVSMTQVKASDWTSADGLTGLYDNTVAGGASGASPPDQVAILLNYDTNLRYRGGRGRLYLPQTEVSFLENGQTWTDAFVGDVEGAMALIYATVNAMTIGSATVTWVLYHRGTTNVPQGVEPVLAILCSPTPGTQRRRVRRVGHKA